MTGLQNATCYSAEETNLSTDDAIDDDTGGGGGGGGSGSSTIYAAVGGACGALVLILIGYAYYKGYFCFKVAASDTETETTTKFNRKTKRNSNNSENIDFFESVFGIRVSQDWSNWNRKRDSEVVRDSNNLDYQYTRKDIVPDERMLPGKLEEGFFPSSNINMDGKTDSTFFDNPIRRANEESVGLSSPSPDSASEQQSPYAATERAQDGATFYANPLVGKTPKTKVTTHLTTSTSVHATTGEIPERYKSSSHFVSGEPVHHRPSSQHHGQFDFAIATEQIKNNWVDDDRQF